MALTLGVEIENPKVNTLLKTVVVATVVWVMITTTMMMVTEKTIIDPSYRKQGKAPHLPPNTAAHQLIL